MPKANKKWTLAQRRKFNTTLKRKKMEHAQKIIDAIEPVDPVIIKKLAEYDPVNRPAHYTSGNIEVADFIEDQKLGLYDGTAVKYIARAGKKPQYNADGLMPVREARLQDLKKARWYLNREITNLEKQQS